jgi:hypothetical protein
MFRRGHDRPPPPTPQRWTEFTVGEPMTDDLFTWDGATRSPADDHALAVDHESLVLAYHMSGVGQVERSPRATGPSPPDPTAVMAAEANHRAATVDLQRGQAPRLYRQTGTRSPCQPAGKDPR